MLTDYHTHSYRCGHASGTMRAYIEAALRRGIGEIGLTDHLYLYFQPPGSRSRKWAMPEDEYPRHFEEMLRLREEFRGLIDVRVSVEVDYDPAFEVQLSKNLAQYDFDFILGSVHFIDDWMLDDLDQSDRYRSGSVAEIYRLYYDRVRKLARSALCDVIGHLDLPKKFGYRPEEDLSGEVGRTLDAIAEAGLVVEVSSAGLRKPVREIYPSQTILEQMRARDIGIVLSSDAHIPDEVGAGYEESLPLVRALGYETLSTFDRRERSQQAIE